MESIELSKIYPRDRLSINPNGANMHHDISLSKIPDMLAYLIETKLNSNPTHKMVIERFDQRPHRDGYRALYPHWLVTSVEVYAYNEYIGSLGVEPSADLRSTFKIRLRNRAIGEIMVRNGYIASGKANTLSATYDKFFRPATAIVKANLLRQKAHQAMHNENRTQEEKQRPVTAFVKSLTNHIMENFDKYKEIAISNGGSYNHDTLPLLHSHYTLVNSIAPNLKTTNKDGFYFYASDGFCLATNLQGLKIGAHYANTLPKKLAAKVGMLKLADDKTFVRNVGYRQQQDFFFITGDYNEYT